jgi:hypothetical protein
MHEKLLCFETAQLSLNETWWFWGNTLNFHPQVPGLIPSKMHANFSAHKLKPSALPKIKLLKSEVYLHHGSWFTSNYYVPSANHHLNKHLITGGIRIHPVGTPISKIDSRLP